MPHILIVDDEEGIRSFLQEALESDDRIVLTASDGVEALAILQTHTIALMLTDLKMPNMDGMTLLTQAKAIAPQLTVIVLTAHGSIDIAVNAMKQGAFDFLQKPLEGPKALRLMVKRALEHHYKQADVSPPSLPEGPPLGYVDPAMDPIVEALKKVAPTQATVLLTGESGTGKEVAARKLHAWSERASGPFVAINCAALPEALLESELFGHERGAFTGADARRIGRIEQANGGSFFLDEIGEMNPALQSRLLRVLQERTLVRLGGNETVKCDVRWIAATNRDLQAQVQAGAFREDLYHRLAVFPIHLPPLHQRPADIVPIANHLLERIGMALGKGPLSLSHDLTAALPKRHWPGNVRELSNALERAAILSNGTTIELANMPAQPHAPGVSGAPATPGATLASVERDAIAQALSAVDGNRRKAAELLGIAERTLYDKIKRYDL